MIQEIWTWLMKFDWLCSMWCKHNLHKALTTDLHSVILASESQNVHIKVWVCIVGLSGSHTKQVKVDNSIYWTALPLCTQFSITTSALPLCTQFSITTIRNIGCQQTEKSCRIVYVCDFLYQKVKELLLVIIFILYR